MTRLCHIGVVACKHDVREWRYKTD